MAAYFRGPTGVVWTQGLIFVADSYNDRIRKIDLAGRVTTFAGNGIAGFVDGTSGLNGTAEFNLVNGLGIDASHNLYVTELNNNAIRKIDVNGNVTTIAGNGTAGFVDGTGGAHGTAEFNQPQALVVDAQGNIFVADQYNNAIRKIDMNGNVTTFAGNGTMGYVDGTGGPNGTAEFDFPTGLAFDGQGNLLVADQYNNRVRKIDVNGNVTTVAGNGTAGFVDGTGGVNGTAEFNIPASLVVDGHGNIIVADEGNNSIRAIDPSGNVTTLAGNGMYGFVDGTGGPHGSAEFSGPVALALDTQGNIIVADLANERIRQVDANGNVTTLAGSSTFGFADGQAQPTETAEFNSPWAVRMDNQNNILVADSSNNRIRKIDSADLVSTLAGNGVPGFVDGTAGPNGTASFDAPTALAVDSQGNVFVSDAANERIRKIDVNGNVTTVAGNGTMGNVDGTGGPAGTAEFYDPFGLALDGLGNIFVADSGNNSIRKIDANGNVTTVAGNGTLGFANGTGGRNGTAEFFDPSGVVVDAQGNLLVADTGNNCIRKIDRNGNVTTFAGSQQSGFADGTIGPNGTARFDFPSDLVFDAQGNLLVADAANAAIRKIDPNGNVTTIAGNGNDGFANGTLGMSGTAEFNGPFSLTVDAQGNIFVADLYNNCIRKIVQ